LVDVVKPGELLGRGLKGLLVSLENSRDVTKFHSMGKLRKRRF